MDDFAFASYKHQRDQKLLHRLSGVIFVLKLQAQGKLLESELSTNDADIKRNDLVQFLAALESSVRFLYEEDFDGEFDLDFGSLAKRFIDYRIDVPDRLDEIRRLRENLQQGLDLRERHFQLLDRLQELLEAETANNVQSLFRL